MLSFLQPMSSEVYLCVGIAYLGVSFVLLIASRLSPTEWKIENNDEKISFENSFTTASTLWFSLSAFLQQGIEILPKYAENTSDY